MKTIVVVLVFLFFAGSTATFALSSSAQAHTLLYDDADTSIYLRMTKHPYYLEEVGHCWRPSKHRVSCFVTWMHADLYGYPNDALCGGVVSVKYRSSVSYAKRVRIVSRYCEHK